MKKVILEFHFKRGVVNTADLEEESQEIHDHCLELIRQGKNQSCVEYLLPKMSYEWSWMNGDISANPKYGHDLSKALTAITAKTILMPSQTDLYFRVEDNAREMHFLPNAELRVIPSTWGHRAGNPSENPDDEAFIRQAVEDLFA